MKLLPMLLHTCYFYRVQRKLIPRDRKSIPRDEFFVPRDGNPVPREKCPVPRDGNPVPHGTVNFPVIGTVGNTSHYLLFELHLTRREFDVRATYKLQALHRFH